MKIVLVGDSFRSLRTDLEALGHQVRLIERYRSLAELKTRWWGAFIEADAVVVGSSVPEGVEAGRWVTRVARGVTALYERDGLPDLPPDVIDRYDLSLSSGPGAAELVAHLTEARARLVGAK